MLERAKIAKAAWKPRQKAVIVSKHNFNLRHRE
jgi:hypothetical protein